MCDKTRLIRKTIHIATKKWSKSSIFFQTTTLIFGVKGYPELKKVN